MSKDFKPKNPAQEWFCYNCYAPAGRPKMESEILDFARKRILYHRVFEGDFKDVISELQDHQDRLAEKNSRWKRVDCYFTNGMDDNCWLVIGESNLQLRKILGIF